MRPVRTGIPLCFRRAPRRCRESAAFLGGVPREIPTIHRILSSPLLSSPLLVSLAEGPGPLLIRARGTGREGEGQPIIPTGALALTLSLSELHF